MSSLFYMYTNNFKIIQLIQLLVLQLQELQQQQEQLEQMYQQQQAIAQQQGGGQVENGIVHGADQNAVAQAMSLNNNYYQSA